MELATKERDYQFADALIVFRSDRSEISIDLPLDEFGRSGRWKGF
jgi:hypothetical protein